MAQSCLSLVQVAWRPHDLWSFLHAKLLAAECIKPSECIFYAKQFWEHVWYWIATKEDMQECKLRNLNPKDSFQQKKEHFPHLPLSHSATLPLSFLHNKWFF